MTLTPLILNDPDPFKCFQGIVTLTPISPTLTPISWFKRRIK